MRFWWPFTPWVPVVGPLMGLRLFGARRFHLRGRIRDFQITAVGPVSDRFTVTTYALVAFYALDADRWFSNGPPTFRRGAMA